MNLTEREKEVLKMLCLPDRIISRKLNISLSTVKTHIRSLYNKFPCATSRTCLIVEALKQKLINLDNII